MSGVALFFDRDGVLNVNTHYPHLVEDLYLAPTVVETFRLLNCFPELTCIVVSNQSGVGKGYFTEKDVLHFERSLRLRILNETGYLIDTTNWYHCYSSEKSHPWRKPNPGMLQQAAHDWNIDLTKSAMFGDSVSDTRAGENANIPNTYMIDYDLDKDLYHGVFDFLYNHASLSTEAWQKYFNKELNYV